VKKALCINAALMVHGMVEEYAIIAVEKMACNISSDAEGQAEKHPDRKEVAGFE
jgi:hypothetical protein